MKELYIDGSVVVAILLVLLLIAAPVQANATQDAPPTPDATLPADQPAGSAQPPSPEPLAAPSLNAVSPAINVWYDGSLRFGQNGNPQQQVNILGNVSDPDGSVTSLTYSLNGGTPVTLPVGPARNVRLANPGDFNAALNISSLRSGTNNLLLTATDNSGQVTQRAVSFTYTPSRAWQMPYVTNWSAGPSINDQAQVVDGLWKLVPGGVQVDQPGYDRVIAIGDMNWRDYEVVVPVTIYSFFPDPANPTDSGGVGVIARWQGHTGGGVLPTEWRTMGAYGYYSNRNNGLALRINGADPAVQAFNFQLGVTYIFKLRAETTPNGGKYSFKAWIKGQPEPAWNANSNVVGVIDSQGDLPTGSVLLVAHRASAVFGDASICPLTLSYPLQVNVNGSGTVTRTPNKTGYDCGEGVTLTPAPAAGWNFVGWSGDISSSSPNLSFNMTRAYTITANFSRSSPVTYKSRTYLPWVGK